MGEGVDHCVTEHSGDLQVATTFGAGFTSDICERMAPSMEKKLQLTFWLLVRQCDLELWETWFVTCIESEAGRSLHLHTRLL